MAGGISTPSVAMTCSILPLSADTYRVHPIHATDRIWTETNCYVDVWIEILHALNVDPLAAAAFSLSTDFEGDQWTFFKYPPEDLRRAYGIDVHEMNPWRGVLEHVTEQLRLGRFLTMEADSFYLPDTAGVSYQIASVKSTIVPNMVDVDMRRLGYFHNAGYFELEGADFDGVFRVGEGTASAALPPYVEIIRLERMTQRSEAETTEIALGLLADHMGQRPRDNPVSRMAERVAIDVAWLQQSSFETFHLWAFGTLRQCGASSEMAAAFCRWLAERTGGCRDLTEAAEHWASLAESAKSLQFVLARVARGRNADFGPTLESMANDWEMAQIMSARAVGL